MAFLSFAEDRSEPQSVTLGRPGEVHIRPSKWEKPVVELFRGVFGLMGFGVGVLMLLFALVWVHSIMH
jgi:hypothetical protein